MKPRKPNRIWLLQAALVSSVSLTALADVSSNPYDAIVSRNPFGLKPPPPPPPPPDESANKPPPPPLADVTLTGIITTILGNNRALIEVIPAPGKPALKPILGEGERIENVEVIAINADKNEVTIRNGTVLTNLTFKVAKSGPTAAPPPASAFANPAAFNPAGQPGQTAAAPPAESGGRYNVMVAGGAGAGATTTATPTPAAYNPGAAVAPAANLGGAANANAVNDGLRSIPQRTVRQSPQVPQSGEAQTPEQRETSRALQYLQMKASEEQAKQRGIPHPPTPPIPGLTE
jgi:hypothetical protein